MEGYVLSQDATACKCQSQIPAKVLTPEFESFTTILYIPTLTYGLVRETKAFLENS